MVSPSRAATTIGTVIGRSPTPTPIATMDSPRAMRMMRPCRRRECDGYCGARQLAT